MPGLIGSLDLVCSSDAGGRTFLSRQAFNAPFHLSKPYWDGQTLLLQVVNPTAGVFAADQLQSQIRIEPRAASTVITPSASRIYLSESGNASLDQQFDVGEGAWLDYLPAMLIPHAGARYRQSTRVRLDRGARCFFLETLAPGRVAMGESLAFDSLKWASDVWHADDLIMRERFCLRPDDGSFAGWQSPIRNAYVATGFVTSPGLSNARDVSLKLRDSNDGQLFVGLSPLTESFWAIRILAGTSVLMRRAVGRLREVLQEQCPLLAGSPRGNF